MSAPVRQVTQRDIGHLKEGTLRALAYLLRRIQKLEAEVRKLKRSQPR